MKKLDFFEWIGLLFILSLVLLPWALLTAAIWIVLHFVAKYW